MTDAQIRKEISAIGIALSDAYADGLNDGLEEVGALRSQVTRLRARIAELEAAILPFAAIADESTANLADNYMYPDCYPMSAFRAAKAALENK